MIEPAVEYWYIQTAVNNDNSPAYVDMIKDMRELKNGVFTCTVKLNDGFICDKAIVESENYVEPVTTKAS